MYFETEAANIDIEQEDIELPPQESTEDAHKKMVKEARVELERDLGYQEWKRRTKSRSKEFSDEIGVDLPSIVDEKITPEHREEDQQLSEAFQELKQNLDWDYYDVRLKEAEYAMNHDPVLQDMDAISVMRLVRAYYSRGESEQTMVMVEAIARLKKNAKHKEKFLSFTPDRKKAFAQFHATRNPDNTWNIKQIPFEVIQQNVVEEDVRSQDRVYPEIPRHIIELPAFQRYIMDAIYLELDDDPTSSDLMIGKWLMSTRARKKKPGEPIKEGIHQDGAKKIMNKIIDRDSHISGGESILYYREPSTGVLIEIKGSLKVLQPGESRSHADADTNLWHSVSDIYVSDDAPESEYTRDLFGSDILDNRPGSSSPETQVSHEVVEEYKLIIATADRLLRNANMATDTTQAMETLEQARDFYAKALEFKNEHELDEPKDFVKMIDLDAKKYVFIELAPTIVKLDQILGELKTELLQGGDAKIKILHDRYPETDNRSNCEKQ